MMRSPSVIVCSAVLVAVMLHASLAFKDVDRRPNPRSCREANMCCQGQNNTCFVFGHRVDRSTDSKRCYCDSNCLIMGDCCMDYHHHCKSFQDRLARRCGWQLHSTLYFCHGHCSTSGGRTLSSSLGHKVQK
ncbi:hypothetical protein RRG08_020148 [Elysia crispata]|uniref:SMB domain-containing protein n=1 Tax=Elysia crispata TaxID=231223 RepID=A0AAE0XPJ1_9GAST|nr:hypothetical protein RRG08_020148 [Elysia crispata]